MAKKRKGGGLRLIADAPVDLSGDGLGFGAYARTLADAVLGAEEPLTIGVFGEWGSGKSSLMRMLQEHLKDDNRVATVWFNAWQYEREDHPIIPLIGTILRTLEGDKEFTDQLGDAADELVSALQATAYGFAVGGKQEEMALSGEEATLRVTDVEDPTRVEALIDRSLYFRAYERLNEVKIPEGQRILVIVDDLDRCFPDRAIRLLESIKLVLSQKGFVFVLGVARRILEGYLEHRYQKKFGIHDFSGRFYLDKIVQLPFQIPSHEGRIQGAFSERLARHVALDDAAFQELLPILEAAADRNPRATVRLVNNLIIDHSIGSGLAKTNGAAEVPLGLYAVTRALQQRWPSAWALLAVSNELCTQVAEWKEIELAGYASEKDEEVSKLASILVGDRDLQALLFSSHGREWLTQSELRAAAARFIHSRQEKPETDSTRAGRPVSYDVFLWYTDYNRSEAAEIAEFLSAKGISFFRPDVDVRPGTNIRDLLQQAVSGSRVYVHLSGIDEHSGSELIDESPKSDEIGELARNLAASGKLFVLPVLLPGSGNERLPPWLKDYKPVDMSRSRRVTKAGMKTLAQSIMQALSARSRS